MAVRGLCISAFLVISLVCLSTSEGDTSVPSPPSDIQFAVSSTERVPVITASWSPLNCRSNPPNCIEPLGYIMTCSAAESKLSTTVWLSERVELDPIRVNITGATPATRYVCKIASFNAYGVGSTGSTIFVDTPESVPVTAPTNVYSSDVTTDSIRLNWHYQEHPSPGSVNTFKLELYYKDNRYPGRHGEHIHDITYNVAEVDRSSVVFSYLLMFLNPGTEYNVLIRAVTAAGEGPPARISQQTASTAPTLVPYDLTGSILSYVHSEPPSFNFQWTIWNTDRHLLQDIAGFIITCSANKTSGVITISEPQFIEDGDKVTHNVFSTVLYFPNTCGSSVGEEIECSVAAFNDRGRGEQGDSVTITLPCSADSSSALESSFLANQSSSLGLLAALILLVLCLLIVIGSMCVWNSWSHHHRKRITSSSLIDENYVPMASTDAGGIKALWSVNGPSSSPVGVALLENGDPAYDEIPADGLDNLYDEIHPCSCQTLPAQLDTAVRDSTVTEYMELSSPLLASDVTNDNTTRYSVADSGVNMTSSDMEHGLNLSLHSKMPPNHDVENIEYPIVAEVLLDDKSHAKPAESSYYNMTIPYSIPDGSSVIAEWNVDTQLDGEDIEAESGVGTESQVSLINATLPNSITKCPNSTTSCPNSTSKSPNSINKRPDSITIYPTKYPDSTPKHLDTTKHPNSITKCPGSTTKRPNSITMCPSSTTKRPNSITICPSSTTKRSNSITRCPSSTTKRITKYPGSTTKRSNSITRCPSSATKRLNSITKCPGSTTKRPSSITICPDSTKCPIPMHDLEQSQAAAVTFKVCKKKSKQSAGMAGDGKDDKRESREGNM